MTPIVINNTLAKIEKYNYKGPVVVDAETVVLECGGVPMEVYIRCIEKDDTLKRISDFSKKNPPKEERYNIVVINLDSMSRANFRREFSSVRRFFREVLNKTDIEIFEFFRYHALDVTTLPNTVAMYTGINHKNSQLPTISTIWDEFYENGYASAAVDNNCLDWSAHYQKQRLSKVDHQFLSPFCLPEIHPQVESPDENFSGSYSVGRCLGNDFSHKYVLEYMSQFIKQYEDFPKFVVGSLNEGHERTGEVLHYLSNDLFNFFNKVDFDSTIVFMVSDHGLHMNALFDAGVESVIKENALGLLTAIFPDKFLKQHPEIRSNLKHNTQALVTPFDISVFPEKPKPRESLSRSLLDEISYSRTCEEAKIPNHFCICNKQL